jgi:hypothetical protein
MTVILVNKKKENQPITGFGGPISLPMVKLSTINMWGDFLIYCYMMGFGAGHRAWA